MELLENTEELLIAYKISRTVGFADRGRNLKEFAKGNTHINVSPLKNSRAHKKGVSRI